MNIGIVGCGTIGSRLARYIVSGLKDRATLLAVCDIDSEKAKKLAEALDGKTAAMPLESLIEKVDFVIEAASAKISFDVAAKTLKGGKDIMIMSTGGLLKGYKKLFELAEKKKAKIYLPSGAICGIDGLKAAKAANIKRVTLRTIKPPEGLRDAPYVVKNKINLGNLRSDKVIFRGTAAEAIRGFPANINVAATLSICGIGPEKTRVEIVASAHTKRNIHEVAIEGEFGKLVARTENVPSPDNPKTSYLAVLSAIAALNGILGQIRVGT